MPKILVLPGDGIGGEVTCEAVKVLKRVAEIFALGLEFEEALVGGCAYDATGHPLPETTLRLARAADAVLLGAVGGPKWEGLDYAVRPERALLGLRSQLGLFANLRPAKVYAALADASTLKREVVEGIDIMVVRELTGGLYFGQPRGITGAGDNRRGVNTLVYTTSEIRRIAKVACEVARTRTHKVCSVDKANVLEATELWRWEVEHVAKNYPDVTLSHMYVDNCAMQLVRNPRQFDVILTSNLFGDILSDEAAQLTGSIGMLPSASLPATRKGLYEPVHGSAPDIAGKGIANPLATILSVAMMCRYTLQAPAAADWIELAVEKVLHQGVRTADIAQLGDAVVATSQMGAAVLQMIG